MVRAGSRHHRRRRASYVAAARDRAVAGARRLHGRGRGAGARAPRRPDRRRLDAAADAGDQRQEDRLVAIIVDTETRLVVQGLTGSEGRFHGLRNRAYGTNLVAGVTPGKGGQDVDGVPVFDTVAEAVDKAGANARLIFVPARFAGDSGYEAV